MHPRVAWRVLAGNLSKPRKAPVANRSSKWAAGRKASGSCSQPDSLDPGRSSLDGLVGTISLTFHLRVATPRLPDSPAHQPKMVLGPEFSKHSSRARSSDSYPPARPRLSNRVHIVAARSGAKRLESPQILPLDAYVLRLWDIWLARGTEAFNQRSIDTRQESFLLGANHRGHPRASPCCKSTPRHAAQWMRGG